MKKILAVTHLEYDIQIESVRKHAKQLGFSIITLCTNTLCFEPWSLEQKSGEIILRNGNSIIQPSTIWFATYPREDSLFHSKMRRYRYPGEYRSTVTQFMTDLRLSFEKMRWLPGNFENILRGDSKLLMYMIAQSVGFQIPLFTMNATHETYRKRSHHRRYRKKLGFPSVISFSKSSKQEVVVTTSNSMGTSDSSFLLWQWQTPIESVAHVRCFFAKNTGWAVKWQRDSELNNLIDYRTIDEKGPIWEPTTLPDQIWNKVKKMCVKLRLSMCCPEFLLTTKGELILIDLNPCGDWFGFFSEKTRQEIAQTIVRIF